MAPTKGAAERERACVSGGALNGTSTDVCGQQAEEQGHGYLDK
ncbi:hypothetical protein [Streptacidiphilus sp. ASG 303]|nr:hypothetical protein [Streptacidiphilus sp. ASG 303]